MLIPAPGRPGVITVIGVDVVDWTWEINGSTYPDTAEVTDSAFLKRCAERAGLTSGR